ncbi:MAG: YggS family pyridoxal phosphate-dependent enzyme [Fibrobacterota bacterium]
MSLIKMNLSRIKERIAAAAERSGRTALDVTLVAVTKTRSLEEIDELKQAGVAVVGESRVQELAEKSAFLKERFSVHFIGHLQTNKVKQAIRMADMIQSVDSLRLLSAIDTACRAEGTVMPVLLQVNASQEVQKHGFEHDELPEALAQATAMKNISVRGLMTMAMFTGEAEKIRNVFRSLRMTRETMLKMGFPLPGLSMGMSGDFEIAVEEGATMVRVGGALFESE